jgi:flagellin FlaB
MLEKHGQRPCFSIQGTRRYGGIMMDRIMRYVRKNRRGIVGIEAAIVMIAFVVIAAALAYVVINMGFYAAQTAKSTIDKGIKEATSALELDGFITGRTNATGNVTFLAIPVKLAVAQQQVDMNNNTVIVAVAGKTFALANIYNGSQVSAEISISNLMDEVSNSSGGAPVAECFIYNSANPTDTGLQQNAKAYVVISLSDQYGLAGYDKVKIEIRTSVGAALMVQRDIPGGLADDQLVDLG